MNSNLQKEAFDIAKEFTLETIKNSSIGCNKMKGNLVVEYFNAIYDGIFEKLHAIAEKE